MLLLRRRRRWTPQPLRNAMAKRSGKKWLECVCGFNESVKLVVMIIITTIIIWL
jgi:hypothetical protein